MTESVPQQTIPTPRRRVIRRCLAVAATLVVCGAPLAFLLANRKLFALPQIAIGFSWLAFLAATVGIASVALLVHGIFTNKARRRAVLFGAALIEALVIYGVAFIYVGSQLSTKAWGDNLTFQIVAQAILHPFASLDLAGISPDSKFTVIAIVVAAALAGLGVMTALCALILSELAAWALDGNGRVRRLAVGGLLAIAVLAGGACLLIGLTKADRLAGEPLLSFAGFAPTSNLMNYDAERVLAALQDREASIAYRVPATFNRKNVILIFSDAVRADRLKPYGYGRETTPFLSGLYADGKLAKVEMAISPCADSYCGIATTLSSRYFYQLSNEGFKLNTVLRKAGYRIEYFLSGEHMAWSFLGKFYGNDIDKTVNVVAGDDVELLKQFSETSFSKDAPHFMYFFLMSTHTLGKRLPEYEFYKPADFGADLLWKLITQKPSGFDDHGVALYPPLEPKDREELSNRYDNGLRQSDALISNIFSHLDRQGLLSNAMVFIVADHGDGLGERGHVAHARFLYQKDVRVPLLIYDSDLSPYRNREFATLLDVAPTIVDRLGLPIPKSWQGVPITRPSGARNISLQTRWRQKPCAAVMKKDINILRKYIRCRWEGRPDSEEAFDLIADPDELQNIVGEIPADELNDFRAQVAPRLARIVCPGQGATCANEER